MKRKDIFFMNGHHYEIFRRVLPEHFNDIDKGNQLSELRIGYLKNQHPNTLKALEMCGLV